MRPAAHRNGLWLGLLAVLLSACAPVRQREDASLSRAQLHREAVLSQHPAWSITARIAVSDGQDSGSGQLEWRQNGEHYDFTVHAPVTGKTWHLYGNREHVVLEGVQAQPFVGTDAERLLREKLGWHVPVAQLSAWVRALRAEGPAVLSYNEQSLPAVLQQSKWTVEYKEYSNALAWPMPRKVFASQKSYTVRVVIEHWSFEDGFDLDAR